MVSWDLNRNKGHIFTIGAIAAAVGYFFSIATGSIGMIILILAWLINFREINFSLIFKNRGYNILFAFYVLIIICSIYSINSHQAQKEIVRFLSFAIFPLIFATSNITNDQYKHIKKGFIISLVIFFVICLLNAMYRQFIFSQSGGPFNWYFFYRYDFLEIFRQHPTYLSIFTLLGLSFLIFSPPQTRPFFNNFLKIGLTCILIFALALYGSRIGYIIFTVLVFIYIINLLMKNRAKEVILILCSFLFLLLGAWNIPIIKERILFTLGEKYQYQFNNSEAIVNGSPENQGRLLLWQDAYDLIKERPLLGYGTGASKKILTEKYKQEGHDVFLKERYNAHNTYLELLLWGGMVLLISYLVVLGFLLRFSIIYKDLIALSFYLIIFISGITETIFLAQGIMFFAFFYSFFLNKKSNG